MAKLVFHDLTLEQAKALAEWFDGAGAQDCRYWLSELNIPSPQVDWENKVGITVAKEKDEVHVRLVTLTGQNYSTGEL